ncbi:MAG TPA: single-stranded DNA-binding protein [Ktedonobacterales bacterium]|nr:single-stranded DNA-binding protein [Ktedonobacterales bacterium]
MNKIMLIGRLGKDPEMSYTASGQAMTKFTLAVSRRWKDSESGERREETTWFNIVAWRQLAETCNNYLHKGSKVYIEGRMNSRKYTDKDGIERTVWDVTAADMEMLDPKGAGQGGAQGTGFADDVSGDDLPF